MASVLLFDSRRLIPVSVSNFFLRVLMFTADFWMITVTLSEFVTASSKAVSRFDRAIMD